MHAEPLPSCPSKHRTIAWRHRLLGHSTRCWRQLPNQLPCTFSYQRGLSLIELCIVLVLISGGALYAHPQLRNFLEDARSITLTNHLVSLLHYSRIQALVHQQSVTLCQLEAGACQRPWREALTVFVDQTPIGKLGANDRILITSELPTDRGIIYWRSFRRKPYLNFTALGETHSQNGHMITCSAPGASATARKVVINRQGRTRLEPRGKPNARGSVPEVRAWAKEC